MRHTPIAVDVLRPSRLWNALPGATALLRKAAVAAARSAPATGSEPVGLALVLADDRRVRDLNAGWRGKDLPTNVLSFPAPPGPAGAPRHLGDVILAFETVEREADEQGKTLAAHAGHLVVHGVLHLIGHDHDTPERAAVMESLEVALLARLGIADPYADSEPVL
jgi:probable rRNA maturation factor